MRIALEHIKKLLDSNAMKVVKKQNKECDYCKYFNSFDSICNNTSSQNYNKQVYGDSDCTEFEYYNGRN